MGVELSQGIAYITLNRPGDSNVLSESMYTALCDACFNLHERKDISAVVLSGEGSMFCAGSDPNIDGLRTFRVMQQSPAKKQSIEDLMERGMKLGAFPNGRKDYAAMLKCK